MPARKKQRKPIELPAGECSYCGDPIVGLCERLRPEWIVVRAAEVLPGDRIRRPLEVTRKRVIDCLGKKITSIEIDKKGNTTMFRVKSIVVKEAVRILTEQKRVFSLPPDIPVLVERNVACGWPRCELHCSRCLSYAEDEARRAELIARQEAEKPKRRKAPRERDSCDEKKPKRKKKS